MPRMTHAGSRPVKRERDGADKAGDADGSGMAEQAPPAGGPSTKEVEQVPTGDEDEEEEQGAKRARVTVVHKLMKKCCGDLRETMSSFLATMTERRPDGARVAQDPQCGLLS